MKMVDIHEFVEHIDETLRLLKERGETVELVDNGEVVARLLPPLEQQASYSSDEASDRAWANLERLSAEIGKRWTSKTCENLEVTNDGEVIAHLAPTGTGSSQRHVKRNPAVFLDMLNQHTGIVSAQITEKDVDAVNIIREGRREF